MDAAAELGRNPVSVSATFSLSMEMSRLARDGTAEPSRETKFSDTYGTGGYYFLCSADHEQD